VTKLERLVIVFTCVHGPHYSPESDQLPPAALVEVHLTFASRERRLGGSAPRVRLPA